MNRFFNFFFFFFFIALVCEALCAQSFLAYVINGKKALTVRCNMLIDEKVKYDEIVKINTTDWAEKKISIS